MKRKILMLFLVFCVVQVYAQQNPSITVLDFKTNNVSQGDMQSIISFLSAALFDSGMYTVIDSSQRDTILKELEFSMSGCTDESCQLEIGRLLSAEMIVIGDIGQIGSRYMLTAKILETETSKTLGTAKGIYPDLDNLLDDMNGFAMRLAKGEVAEQTVPVEEPDQADTGPEEREKVSEPLFTGKTATILAWSTLTAGTAAAGIGAWLIYAAVQYRADILNTSYNAYKDETITDFGGLSSEEYYHNLYNIYLTNLSTYSRKAIFATSLTGLGVLSLGSSVLFFLMPTREDGAAVSLYFLPGVRAAAVSCRVRY